MSTRTVLLVRHAHAGVRGTWPGSDLERPLDDLGRADADNAVARLRADATALRASPAERCRATLRPLAAATGLPLVDARELLEGTHPEDALRWLLEQPHGTVACTHGDVIDGVMALLAKGDVAGADREPTAKGAWWRLEVEADRVRSAGRHPVPHTDATVER